jgi:hypothetical protein
MAGHFDKNSAVNDYHVKSERLLIPFAIVFHATPASKTTSSDLGSALVVVTEGLTAVATAIDSGTSFTTPVDATGLFSLLIYNLGTVSKLLKVEMIDLDSGTVTLLRKGASTTGVTASGNIAISADWSGNLATTSLAATIAVDYIISKA